MDEYVESVKEGLEESKRFFSNPNKQNREVWVLREFLSYLPMEVSNEDISPSNVEPDDVFYGKFGFQIKEVLSEGRRRGKEYSDKLAAIKDETKPEDLLEQYTPIHIPLDQALPRVAFELARHRVEKYKGNTSQIDVLVYLNLSDTTYANSEVRFIHDEFMNWRSVSLVSNNCAIVLACEVGGHEFLVPLVSNLYVKN